MGQAFKDKIFVQTVKIILHGSCETRRCLLRQTLLFPSQIKHVFTGISYTSDRATQDTVVWLRRVREILLSIRHLQSTVETVVMQL